MSTIQTILHRAPAALTRLAGCVTLAALALMAFSILVPKPLPIVLAMSLGHVVGLGGFVLYFFAVLIDAARPARPSSGPPPADASTVARNEKVVESKQSRP